MAGPGAEVLRRLGAIVVVLPGSEILSSLKSGAIDAAEWVGPWLDMAFGLHEVAGYYYYPAWHEPGSAQTLGINRGVWESLDANDRRVIEAAAAAEYANSLAEFSANNALALRKLREDGVVRIMKFDESMLRAFSELAEEVLAEIAASTLSRGESSQATVTFAAGPWIGAMFRSAHVSTAALSANWFRLSGGGAVASASRTVGALGLAEMLGT